MILILSQDGFETTTDRVMDWLEAADAAHLRLNGTDVSRRGHLELELDADGTRIRLGGTRALDFNLDEVRTVWARRWSAETHLEMLRIFPDDAEPAPQPNTSAQIRRQLAFDLHKLSDFFFDQLADRPWLSRPSTSSPNKLSVLERAAALGMDVPATLVTTKRSTAASFTERFGSVITKAIGEVDMFPFKTDTAMLYTAALDSETIAQLPETFFPSLFQETIEKTYEIRVFYLAGRCYSMAIFSQSDSQTAVDFRNYNYEKPNRNVPYQFPAELEAKIDKLMRQLDLETGSLDFIKARDGRDVFLEVNPVGQFGMVSQPCNYRLEKRVAELLTRKAEGAEA